MPHSTAIHNTATIGGSQVDVVSLETIDYGRLASKEPAEVEKLLHASQMPGFFHLDFQNEPTKEVLTGLRDVYAVAEKYFDEPPEGEMKGQDSGWVFSNRSKPVASWGIDAEI